MRPGILAVRAANEYRGRDVISYLGLRYYLRATSARTDRWAKEISTDLVMTRKTLPYRKSNVYKGVSDRTTEGGAGIIEQRPLHIPAPNEMLCEAALLEACSNSGGMFARQESVFSNILCTGDSRAGMVDPYFKWWKQRQLAIAKCCKREPEDHVVYFDLAKFYQSIGFTLVQDAWDRATSQSSLPNEQGKLGAKLIEDYRKLLGVNKKGLPMGPMFAHILGNLVLSDFDKKMAESFPGKYFRYVDDLALVIPKEKIPQAKALIEDMLPEGLKLNNEKEVSMGANGWVGYTEGFETSVPAKRWRTILGAIKGFIGTRPKETAALFQALQARQFRFPVWDYADAFKSRSTWERFKENLRQEWLRNVLDNQDLPVILRMVEAARTEFMNRFDHLAELEVPSEGMPRKLHFQRLRYMASRLLYLATDAQLRMIVDSIEHYRELADLVAIYRALISFDVSNLLIFTESVTRVAAQVLAATGKPVTCKREIDTEDLIAAWSVLKLHGIKIVPETPSEESLRSPLAAFSDSTISRPPREILSPYFDELLALQNLAIPEPALLLRTALDEAENPSFDATLLFQGSS